MESKYDDLYEKYKPREPKYTREQAKIEEALFAQAREGENVDAILEHIKPYHLDALIGEGVQADDITRAHLQAILFRVFAVFSYVP